MSDNATVVINNAFFRQFYITCPTQSVVRWPDFEEKKIINK